MKQLEGSHALRFALWRLRDTVRERIRGTAHTRDVFARIHADNAWGAAETVSGPGSTAAATSAARMELPRLFEQLGVRSLLDAACGDFSWMKHIVWSLSRYTGVDIVAELVAGNQAAFGTDCVRFMSADISVDPLPDADMILCRDCFIHLPSRQIRRTLLNFCATRASFLALTSDAGAAAYHDIPVGSFRAIDFRQPPFAFPEPVAVVAEDGTGNRQLCVWPLSDIRTRVRG